MRRSLTLILLLTACAGPKLCTRTLCVTRLDGALELRGWSGTVRAASFGRDSYAPQPPVPSDCEVAVVYGSAQFANGEVRVSAEAGAVFRFTVSTAAVASIAVSSGSVTVVLPSSTRELLAGSSVFLPKPR